MPPKNNWYAMAYSAKEDENQVEIYDQIGYYGITASQFSADLKALDSSKKMKLRLNTPGGDVFEGMTIYNLLNEYPSELTVVVDGIAASMGSVIAMAGDKILMHDTAMMMIHKPWTLTMGNADQLRKDADLLDKIQVQIISAYKTQTKLDDADLNALVDGETWLTADEAFENGLADEVIKQKKKDRENNSIEKRIDAMKSHEMFAKFSAIPNKIAACIKHNADITATIAAPNPIENKNVSLTTIQNKESVMTPEEIKAMQDKIASEAKAAEKTRQSEIRALGKALKLNDTVIENAVEKNLSIVDAQSAFIVENAKTMASVPQTATVSVTVDESDKFRALASLGIQNACGLVKDKEKQIEARKNNAPSSLHGLFRTVLARNGVKGVETLDGHNLVKTLHNELVGTGTGDLTNVLADTLNKALDNSMELTRVQFPAISKNQAVKDFRQFTLAKLSSVSNVKEIKENDGFSIGSISDKKEVGAVTTQGVFMSLSRQAQIDDDLGALVGLGSFLGRSIMDAQNRSCFETMFGSAGAGPLMTEDGIAMLDVSTHGNYITSGGAAPSSTTVDAGVLAMMTRPKLKGNPSDKTEPTGAMPRFLVVPPKHKGAAERLTNSLYYPEATYNQVYNMYSAQGSTPLQTIVVPYLASLDADQWYLLADPMEIPTIVRLTLNGNENPFIEQDIARGKDPLGFNFRCYYDWGFMIGDWRGVYANDGDA